MMKFKELHMCMKIFAEVCVCNGFSSGLLGDEDLLLIQYKYTYDEKV